MTCIVCNSKFYHQTMSEPAEPCDCGNCLTDQDWRESDNVNLAGMRARWALECREFTLTTDAEPFYATYRDIADGNKDDDDTMGQVAAMAVGEVITIGGGASVETRVERTR